MFEIICLYTGDTLGCNESYDSAYEYAESCSFRNYVIEYIEVRNSIYAVQAT